MAKRKFVSISSGNLTTHYPIDKVKVRGAYDSVFNKPMRVRELPLTQEEYLFMRSTPDERAKRRKR